MPSLRSLLGIEVPIVQAPMAGVQGAAMAAAVSSAGGLGSLPAAMLSIDLLRGELARLTTLTSKPFNVNFFCHRPPAVDEGREAAWRLALTPYYAALNLPVDAALPAAGRTPFDDAAAAVLNEIRPAVVSFHFGLPSPELVARVRAMGSKIISSATTVDEAQWLESRGIDAIIAQGLEAGGHRGHFLTDDLSVQMGTFALVPQIVRAVRVPVIAAGGIATANDVRAALMLGAAGVQVGTAFLLCPEATTSAAHRAALVGSGARHTVLTNVFTGRPARSLVNRLITELGAISELPPAFPLAAAALAPLRKHAEARGCADFSPLWAGQSAAECRSVSAAELTLRLAAGCP